MIGIIEHLEKLGGGEIQPDDVDSGICYALFDRFGSEMPTYTFKSWPKFTGNLLYPVPLEDEDPKMAYDYKDLWSNDDYGDNRRELCLHIASELRKEIR